jgi:hypothetical protein
VHHPEQPALSRVFDVGVWRKPAGAIQDADVRRVPDLRVDIVSLVFELKQGLEHFERGLVLVAFEVVTTRAEAGPAKQMFDAQSIHDVFLLRAVK